ncbi:MAG: hypothetical protein ACREI9_04630 [Nitrospiraceae bacterium]
MTTTARAFRVYKLTRLPADKDRQVDITVREMMRIAGIEAWNPEVRWLLHHLALPHYSRLELAQSATRFIRERLPFELDPEDVELVRTPSWYARNIRAGLKPSGDCDDFALLLVTVLAAAGFGSLAFVVMSRSPTIREFGHVFVAAGIGGKWEYFDPSVSRPYSTDGLRRKWYVLPRGVGPPAL